MLSEHPALKTRLISPHLTVPSRNLLYDVLQFPPDSDLLGDSAVKGECHSTETLPK